jgi:hypothetical protein
MNIVPRLTSAALAALSIAGPASPYTLWPLNTRSHMTGTLKFVNGQHQPAFRCKVDLVIRTRNPEKGSRKDSEIISVKIVYPSKSCKEDTLFNDPLPWDAGALNASMAAIAIGGWRGAGASCSQAETPFTVDANGVWTAPAGNCFVGTLTTNPPITISPSP